ncbi:PREDICTED: ankyrin repeat and EF-hand domain-containing protein 1-like isoform X2 [Priapulus caudatus]|uniref:Ankyrin repeat and EF-hand domain-containing protein 1-like isoform X2 n=1 Tax=Priapulus caudatus TaxID=37621 RepID=A0ABM1FB64_PRICU|nr:PREDICTED: ankyrin repeat and EF-hand domain-containing protein 1-like isoform X2 [Priapulus caudatus]
MILHCHLPNANCARTLLGQSRKMMKLSLGESRLVTLQVTKLMQLIRKNQHDKVENLVGKALPNIINFGSPETGETPLHWAAINNDDESASLLLRLGADTNVVDTKMRTPAMRAAEYGHVQMLLILLEAGAEMNIKDSDGRTIVFYCLTSTRRHVECLNIILSWGADPNVTDEQGRSALIMAAEGGPDMEEVCLAMLQAGASLQVTDKTGKTPLLAACSSKAGALLLTLLERGANPNNANYMGITPAHWAAEVGYLEALIYLSAYGANFNIPCSTGDTPLHMAARSGSTKICKFLSLRGCEAKTKNNDGLVAKILAKEMGWTSTSKELRRAEKLPSRVPSQKMVGATFGEPEAVRLYDWSCTFAEKLVDEFQLQDSEKTKRLPADTFWTCLEVFAAPVDDTGKARISDLHDKNGDGTLNYVEFLKGTYVPKQYRAHLINKEKKKKGTKKAKGAKKGRASGKSKHNANTVPICVNTDMPLIAHAGVPQNMIPKYTPFIQASRLDNETWPENPIQDDSMWYEEKPRKTYISLSEAARAKDFESMLDAFECNHATVNVQDKYYRTPLISACADGNIEAAEFLLQHGADVNALDNLKWTALHHACYSGSFPIVKLLIQYGANVNSQSLYGATPLMRAIQTSKIDVINFLILKGAQLHYENKKGLMAVDVAREWAMPDVVAFIESLCSPELLNNGSKGKSGKSKGKGKSTANPKGVQRSKSTPAKDVVPSELSGPDSLETKKASGRQGDRRKKSASGATSPPVRRAASTPPSRPTSTPLSRLSAALDRCQEDITFTLPSRMRNYPNRAYTTEWLEERRKRYGSDAVDFSTIERGFEENAKRVFTENVSGRTLDSRGTVK